MAKQWLSHLDESITPEASITGVSLYTIALEGWRRGLKLQFYTDVGERKRIKYSLTDGYKKHYFSDSSGDLNSENAIEICDNKDLTYSLLEKNGVPIPKSIVFNEKDSINEVLDKISTLKYPLVVKPIDGFGGKGVYVNIKNEKELIESIEYNVNVLKFKDIIVQEYIVGSEIRVYVLANKVLAAANRIPAFIIGDGNRTIRELIERKNIERLNNPNLRHRLIKVDFEMHKIMETKGYSIDTILSKNECLYLRTISNVSLGGDPVDVTDELTRDHIKIAEAATKSIQGLVQCGVDMIVNKETGHCKIIELNASPGIGSHLFPVTGTAKDIPKQIIDYYFPYTKDRHRSKPLYYFDLNATLDPLRTGLVDKIDVAMYPNNNKYTKLLTIALSKDEILNLKDDIFDMAKKSKVHGYINIKNNEIEILLRYASNKQIEEIMCQISKFNYEEKEPIDKPIKTGFHILYDNNEISSVSQLEQEHLFKYREYKSIEKENAQLEKEITNIKNSRFWKMMKFMKFLSFKRKQ